MLLIVAAMVVVAIAEVAMAVVVIVVRLAVVCHVTVWTLDSLYLARSLLSQNMLQKIL